MRLQTLRTRGKEAYNQLSDGLRSVGSIIEKSAHVYALTHPMLRQSFDTRGLDKGLLTAYANYQHSRQFAHQIDSIINHGR